jgi:hypothetical protein
MCFCFVIGIGMSSTDYDNFSSIILHSFPSGSGGGEDFTYTKSTFNPVHDLPFLDSSHALPPLAPPHVLPTFAPHVPSPLTPPNLSKNGSSSARECGRAAAVEAVAAAVEAVAAAAETTAVASSASRSFGGDYDMSSSEPGSFDWCAFGQPASRIPEETRLSLQPSYMEAINPSRPEYKEYKEPEEPFFHHFETPDYDQCSDDHPSVSDKDESSVIEDSGGAEAQKRKDNKRKREEKKRMKTAEEKQKRKEKRQSKTNTAGDEEDEEEEEEQLVQKKKAKKRSNPALYRQSSPDLGTGPFKYVTLTDLATHLYAVADDSGKRCGAFSISPIGVDKPGVAPCVPLTIKLFLKPKNHFDRIPTYPCPCCGTAFTPDTGSKYNSHPCVLTSTGNGEKGNDNDKCNDDCNDNDENTEGEALPVEIFGHLCSKCYSISKRGYYCVLRDNIVVLTAFTPVMGKDWKKSCKDANQLQEKIPNTFFSYADHHPDWFQVNEHGQLVYIGRKTFYKGEKLLCIHGASAQKVSQQYMNAFPTLSHAPLCQGGNVLLASKTERDISSYIQHRFAESPVVSHGPFPNAKVTTYGIVEVIYKLKTNDVVFIDYGFKHFWKQVHGDAAMPQVDFEDRTFAHMAEQVVTLFPNDVTKLKPAQFMMYMSRRIPAAIWNGMESMLPKEAASLHALVLDAKTVLTNVQYDAMMALLPVDFI